MVADERIEILLELTDEMSGKLDVIQGKIGDFSKSAETSSDRVTQSFQTQIGSLVALGNAAASVDRIMSSYQNLQLRLENANERVANAQDRVADSQEHLRRLQESGNATAYELADAQTAIDRANRNLIISQNNLEKANNAVVGTYINMGIQGLTLVSSIPTMVKSIQGLGGTFTALTAQVNGTTAALVGPAGLLIAMGAVVGYIEYQYIKSLAAAAQAQENYNKAVGDYSGTPGVMGGGGTATTTARGTTIPVSPEQAAQAGYNAIVNGVGNTASSSTGVSKYSGLPIGASYVKNSNGTYKQVSDAIITKTGEVIKTHPNDTIFATQNPNGMGGGGVSITIEGNVYGTDPTEMAEAFFKKLKRKIAV